MGFHGTVHVYNLLSQLVRLSAMVPCFYKLEEIIGEPLRQTKLRMYD